MVTALSSARSRLAPLLAAVGNGARSGKAFLRCVVAARTVGRAQFMPQCQRGAVAGCQRQVKTDALNQRAAAYRQINSQTQKVRQSETNLNERLFFRLSVMSYHICRAPLSIKILPTVCAKLYMAAGARDARAKRCAKSPLQQVPSELRTIISASSINAHSLCGKGLELEAQNADDTTSAATSRARRYRHRNQP